MKYELNDIFRSVFATTSILVTHNYLQYCRRVWLGLYDPATVTDVSDDSHVKDFMTNKYERKRYYLDPSKVSLPKPSPTPQLPLPQQMSTPLARPTVAVPRATPGVLSPNNNSIQSIPKPDPFSPVVNGPTMPQDNFANFDNAPIFNAAAATNLTPARQQSSESNFALLFGILV